MRIMKELLLGAMAMANISIMAFFLKFWQQTKDRFFFYFAVAFLMLGIERVIAAVETIGQENNIVIYLIRLIAFSFIVLAIIVKNIHRN